MYIGNLCASGLRIWGTFTSVLVTLRSFGPSNVTIRISNLSYMDAMHKLNLVLFVKKNKKKQNVKALGPRVTSVSKDRFAPHYMLAMY